MSQVHDASHEELLASILGGELRPEAPRARALAAECPVCAAEIARLQPVAQNLTRAAEEERLILGEIATVRAPIAPRRDSRALWRWAGPLAAAAALIFVFVITSVLRNGAERRQTLGPNTLECLRPKGSVQQYTAFEARGSRPPSGWFRFEIFDADAPPGSEPVLQLARAEETRWTLTPAQAQALPDQIVWWVHAVGADGTDLDRDSESARRVR